MGFSRREYWSGLLNLGTEAASLTSLTLTGGFLPLAPAGKPPILTLPWPKHIGRRNASSRDVYVLVRARLFERLDQLKKAKLSTATWECEGEWGLQWFPRWALISDDSDRTHGESVRLWAPNRTVILKSFCLGVTEYSGGINMPTVSILISTQRLWWELEPRWHW